jgi:hypothetical protein
LLERHRANTRLLLERHRSNTRPYIRSYFVDHTQPASEFGSHNAYIQVHCVAPEFYTPSERERKRPFRLPPSVSPIPSEALSTFSRASSVPTLRSHSRTLTNSPILRTHSHSTNDPLVRTHSMCTRICRRSAMPNGPN